MYISSRADTLHQLIMKLTLLISDQIILINGQQWSGATALHLLVTIVETGELQSTFVLLSCSQSVKR